MDMSGANNQWIYNTGIRSSNNPQTTNPLSQTIDFQNIDQLMFEQAHEILSD